MTITVLPGIEHRPVHRATDRSRPSRIRAFFASSWLWLALIAAAQVALVVRPGLDTTAFQDEGLYLFIGHRMIDHFLHGTVVTSYPGAYFSGAPGFYPVLGALADSVGGLQGARALSLLFVILAMLATYGLGSRLFGRVSGLFGAALFTTCGSVIFQSHLATYDSLMMALVATAAWLVVRSARQDRLLSAPLVAALLAAAFLAKYGGAAYAPVVAALGVAVGWPRHRWLAVRRGAFILVSAAVMVFFVLELWGTDLIAGITSTTFNRSAMSYASTGTLVRQVAIWIGPYLLLALIGGLFRLKRQWAVVIVLLTGAVIAPADQIHIHEATSLAKQCAFGMVFAAPLAGDLLRRLVSVVRAVTVPLTGIVLAALLAMGVYLSGQFLTGWVQTGNLLAPLRADIEMSPHKAILGEEPSPERYALGGLVKPIQWTDTFSFSYGGLQGPPAYVEAIQQSHFGVIFLSLQTTNGRFVHHYLATHRTPYHLTGEVPRYLRGKLVGKWLLYTPRVLGGQ